MLRLAKLFVVVFAVALSGCAATVNRASSGQASVMAPSVPATSVALVITGNTTIKASTDWNTFCAEWRTAFNSAAAAAGLKFSYFEVEPTEQPAGTTLVKISVNDYRYLTHDAQPTTDRYDDKLRMYPHLNGGERTRARAQGTACRCRLLAG